MKGGLVRIRLIASAVVVALMAAISGRAQVPVPRIWNDRALEDWATPIVGLNVRPGHFTEREYYNAPPDNLRTYPVYQPGREPPGYWEWLQKQKPEPLVDVPAVRTNDDWIAAGERAFAALDNVLSRTDDGAIVGSVRSGTALTNALTFADGTIYGVRWVVTERGVMISSTACTACHIQVREDGTVRLPGPPGPRAPTVPGRMFHDLFVALGDREFARRYPEDSLPEALWRELAMPWSPDVRIDRIRTMSADEASALTASGLGGAVIVRVNGSPFYGTKTPDLNTLRYSRYMDATGTHRLRGPEDVARYAALITSADSMDFGPHRMLPDKHRRIPYRYADEVLYAIGMYLMSREPERNPQLAPADVLDRGERVFRRERCVTCHAPPAYTIGTLTLADGFTPSAGHPNAADIVRVSVGTDPGLALKTRKGTGFYKVPSLRGVWYRPVLLHDGSCRSLEEMFDAKRLEADFRPSGWNPPGVEQRAVPGHRFGLALNPSDRAALLAFLRSL